jgi:hypothetical protein
LSTLTVNYGLLKPELPDPADITKMNPNWDILDGKLKELDDKKVEINGAVSNVVNDNLTANRALISNGSGKLAVSPVTSTELGYLDGVTKNVQTQFGEKVNKAGDTMDGMLTFNNTDAYHAFHKVRTIDGATYGVNVGCGILGGEGVVALELRSGATTTGTQFARLEIGKLGVSYVNPSGTRIYLHRTDVIPSTVE